MYNEHCIIVISLSLAENPNPMPKRKRVLRTGIRRTESLSFVIEMVMVEIYILWSAVSVMLSGRKRNMDM